MNHRYTSSLKGTAVAGSCLLACVGFLLHSSRAAETSATDATEQWYSLGLPSIDRDELRRDSALAALGSRLFNDPRLSASGTISCATCHDAAKAFADGRVTPIGVTGQPTTRNAPTLLNVRFEKSLFWDGRESRLESQAVSPLMNPVEHGLASEAAIIEIVLRSPEYARSFESTLGKRASQLKLDDIGNAIAAFERTLLAGESRFDLYYYGSRPDALSEPARRGLVLFQGRAQCATCHAIGPESSTFSDSEFHAATRLPRDVNAELSSLTKRLFEASQNRATRELLVSTDPRIAALGRFVTTLEPQDIGKFKTPSLRNVAHTAPYMHDGSVATLPDAIDRELYGRTKKGFQPIVLTLSERADLLAFLESLTSPALDR